MRLQYDLLKIFSFLFCFVFTFIYFNLLETFFLKFIVVYNFENTFIEYIVIALCAILTSKYFKNKLSDQMQKVLRENILICIIKIGIYKY